MNPEPLFRRLLYLQVVLGLGAFALAGGDPGFFLIAGALSMFSWYLVEGPTGRPLGRWVINFGAVAALGWMAVELRLRGVPVVVASGHLMTWLQVLLLYSRKRNRDYVLILTISLMQLLCASLLSASMLYGLVLLGYSLAGVWTAAVLAMKLAADAAAEGQRAALPGAAELPACRGAVGVAGRWQVHRTVVVLATGVFAVAVGVFVLAPRSADFGAERWGRLWSPPSIGFADEVRLGLPPPSPDDQQAVMSVALSQGGQSFGASGQMWRLRGASLDEYDAATRRWARGEAVAGRDRLLVSQGALPLGPIPPQRATVDAWITLRQAPGGRLFTLFPPVQLATPGPQRVVYNSVDAELSIAGTRHRPWTYGVRAPLAAGLEAPDRTGVGQPEQAVRGGGVRSTWDPQAYAVGWPVQTQRVRALAVQVLEQEGLGEDVQAPQEAMAAEALTEYLRKNYTYSLSTPPAPRDEDPVIHFLFTERRGHCELFASGLAALARSLGLHARVVTGYLTSEFNNVGGYYIVRQSDAHAWCEVSCNGVWRAFDPSPPGDLGMEHRAQGGWLVGLRHLYEHLDFAWVRSVVAYDAPRRQVVISAAAAKLDAWEKDLGAAASGAWRWLWSHSVVRLLGYVAAGLVAMGLVLSAAIVIRGVVVDRRWLNKLRLGDLPRPAARRLAGQLRFYVTMLEMLQSRGVQRPVWQPPGEFARALANQRPERLGPVVGLTQLFYEVRLGGRALDARRRERAAALLRQLSRNLAGRL